MKSRHIEPCHLRLPKANGCPPAPAVDSHEGLPAGLGARYLGPGRCEFLVWAPSSERVELSITAPKKKLLPMKTDGSGYHWAAADAGPGTEYFYRLESGLERPDPASRTRTNPPSTCSPPRPPPSWHGPATSSATGSTLRMFARSWPQRVPGISAARGGCSPWRWWRGGWSVSAAPWDSSRHCASCRAR